MKKVFIKALKRIGFLKRLKINTSITLNNRKIIIPVINEVGVENYFNLSEPWMLYILKKLISSAGYNKAFIDVGVNLGQTLIKVKSVAPSIRYIGFEPNPLCVNYVSSLIAVNYFSNTEIIPVGLGNKSSVLKLNLFSNSDVDSAASIIEGFRSEASVTKTINVPVFKFSDIHLNKDLEFGIIKIDVEGAELEVMEGLKEKIKTDRPVILVEVLPAYNHDNVHRISRQKDIEKLLIQLDYKIIRIIKKDEIFVEPQEIKEFGVHSDLNLCEYVLVPSELGVEFLFTSMKNDKGQILAY